MNRLSKVVACSVTAILALAFQIDDGLTVSEQGLAHIANQEGCRLNAYQCSAHVWTHGIGHTSGVKPGDTVTPKQAAENFVDDVAKAENVVTSSIHKTPTQGELDMMTSFVFNLGAGNFKKSTLLKKFNAGDRVGACNEYPRWVYVNGKNCNLKSSNCGGIPKRRTKEKEVCLNGW